VRWFACNETEESSPSRQEMALPNLHVQTKVPFVDSWECSRGEGVGRRRGSSSKLTFVPFSSYVLTLSNLRVGRAYFPLKHAFTSPPKFPIISNSH